MIPGIVFFFGRFNECPISVGILRKKIRSIVPILLSCVVECTCYPKNSSCETYTYGPPFLAAGFLALGNAIQASNSNTDSSVSMPKNVFDFYQIC